MKLPKKGQYVIVWHPDSPGTRLLVYRPWWRRKSKEFASVAEACKKSTRIW